MEKRRDTRIWDEILYPFDKLDASKSRGWRGREEGGFGIQGRNSKAADEYPRWYWEQIGSEESAARLKSSLPIPVPAFTADKTVGWQKGQIKRGHVSGKTNPVALKAPLRFSPSSSFYFSNFSFVFKISRLRWIFSSSRKEIRCLNYWNYSFRIFLHESTTSSCKMNV